MQLLERPATTNGHVSNVVLEPARRRPRRLFLTAAIVLVIAIVASFIIVRSHAAAVTYTTVPVQTGSLAQTVTASGTLNPQNTIAIGTQVSGTIAEIDADYNTHVKKGQILAKLDPTTFQAALDQAQANLAQTRAQARASGATASGAPAAVQQAEAQAAAQSATARAAVATANAANAAIATAQTNVTKAQSALVLAQRTVARDKQLLAQGYIAQNQADTDEANLVAAQTALDGAQAAVRQAQAQAQAAQAQIATANATRQAQTDQAAVVSATAVNQAATHDASVAAIGIQEAQVKTAKANLANTIITSPVDGTVIARSVSIGQTVAASLQTPTLFTIAQDLRKMELDLAVGEPDIGRVTPGDPVSFSVLAFPNRVFHATVEQVRQNATTVNNVVTYQAVVLVENPDGVLRPGMTANATIQVAHVDGATIVPLAALSYQPPAGAMPHGRRRGTTSAAQSGAPKTGNASPWGATAAASGGAVTSGATGRIFVRRGGNLVPIPVKVGIVADTQASVTPLRGTLDASDQVVVGDDAAASTKRGPANSGNPFSGPAGRNAGAGRGGLLGGAR
jgi:HlyD family secretion protein